MAWAMFQQVLWSSITVSTFYVLLAVAFSLYLKITKVWNFAQAGLFAVGYTCLYFGHRIYLLPAWASIVVAAIVVVVLSLAIEHWGYRILRKRRSPQLVYFILSFMVAEFLIYFVTMVIGTEPQALVPSLFTPSTPMFGIRVTRWDFEALLTTAVLLTATLVFVSRTSLGRKMVAVADNASLAELFRIKPERIYLVTAAFSAVLIVFACWLFGTRSVAVPATSLDLIFVAVISCILGGVGSIGGAAVAAVLLSILRGFSIFIVPSIWQNALIYYGLVVVIVFFPQGIRVSRSWISGLALPGSHARFESSSK